MKSVTKFLEERLRLQVNQNKSAVDRPWKRKFLGFSLYKHKGGYKIRLAPKTVERFKNKVRELTNRNRSQNLAARIEVLNRYLRGWIGYYRLIETPSRFGWMANPIDRRELLPPTRRKRLLSQLEATIPRVRRIIPKTTVRRVAQ